MKRPPGIVVWLLGWLSPAALNRLQREINAVQMRRAFLKP